MKRKQSLSGYVRSHLAQIEADMEAGFSQESIVDDLKAQGFETTVPILRTLLYRARQRASTNPVAPPVVKESPTKPAIPSPAPSPGASPLKKPAGFDYQGTKNIDPNDLI